MTFIINGIKEGLEKRYNIEFLLCIDSTLLAKKLLEETGVIVLSLKEFKEEEKKFGNIYFMTHTGEQEIKVIAQFDGDMSAACDFFFAMGFDVLSINNFANPVSESEMKKIIEESKIRSQKRVEEEKKKIQITVEKEKKVYTDKRLETDKTTIEWAFAKIEQTIATTKGFISGKELKKLKEKEEEIKKLKLWTNHERIKELIEEITTMLEIMENEYFAANPNEAEKIFDGSIVTDVDIQKELSTLDKIEGLKTIGWKIKTSEQDYLLLGKYAIFRKLLLKDILHIFKTPKHLADMIYNAYDLVELGLLFVAISVVVYTIMDTIFLWSNSVVYDYFYQILISYGIIWLLVFWARHLRKKNIPLLLALVPWIIVVYYIVINLINNNFSI